jgi:capsular exopolysaccharide synthesis family protein
MQSTGNPEELPGVISSPLIQSLRTELASLERQHTQLLAKGYLEEYADVVKVRQQIEGTQQRIAHEARRIVRGAENDYQAGAAQERSLAGALEAATAEAQALARKSLKYDALKGDLEASKKLSESILTRQKQTDVSRDVPATNVHIIDAAVVPSVPVRPRPVSDAVLCVVLGLGCALAAAFFRDYLDGSVSRPSDVRRLGLPLLGVIAESRAGRTPPLLVDGGRREAFAEGYRVLRSALDPPEDAKHGQVLLVTSTLPGEGKSLTAVNLALTLASTGERVLLIEADLRRPTLDTLLKTPRTPGLAEVLSRRARLEDAVQPVRSSSLSLLPSGRPAERHAADMLASGALRDLLAGLRGLYDRIVLDTPPAGAVADALALAPIADGVLVVAHCGKVTVNELFHVLERLAQARARILGVVLNRARPDLHRYDYGPSFGLATLGGNGRSLTPVSEIEFDDSTRRVN